MGKSENLITLQKAHIQGYLRVTDRQAFMTAFSRGVGRGRTFGCGLLQIVPIIDTLFN
jgi:CRISPR system Cascade subunit CasE